MSRHTIDITKEVVQSMTFSEEILEKSFDATTNLYTYTLCDNHWLMECSFFEVASVRYKVEPPSDSTDPETQFRTEADLLVGDIVNGLPPAFQSGTPMQAQNEVSQIADWKERSPMAYLLEIIRENYNRQPTEKIDREANIFIYFVATLPEHGKIEDVRRRIVRPLTKMAQAFIEKLGKNGSVIDNLLNEYTMTSFNRWGVYVDRQGTTANIFPDMLGGVEIEINIPFRKDCPCKSCKK
tara:strand:- start:52 stop:768 length:717 start_codon:yes stop_codon:yes gene_type:complete